MSLILDAPPWGIIVSRELNLGYVFRSIAQKIEHRLDVSGDHWCEPSYFDMVSLDANLENYLE